MGILTNLFGGRKALPKEQPIVFQWNGFSFVVSPENIDAYVNQMFLKNPTVYSVIKTLAAKFAAVPWYEYRISDRKALSQYKASTSSYNPNMLMVNKLKAGAMDEVQTTTDFGRLMERPNRAQSQQEFLEATLITKLVTGAAPIMVNKGADNKYRIPAAMYVLPTQYLQLKPSQDLNDIESIKIGINGAWIEIDRNNVYYWRYFNPDVQANGSHLYGLSPLKPLRKVVEADGYNLDAQAFMFKYKGATGLFTPKDQEAARGLQTETAIANARASLDAILSRDSTGTRPIFPVPADYHSFGMDANEMQLAQIRRISKEDIANAFNYPTVLLNAERSTDNNMQHAIKYVLQNTLYGELCGYRDFVNNWLLPVHFQDTNTYYDFDLSVMPELQDDVAKTADIIAKLLENAIISPNEGRDLLKYDAVETDEMKGYYIKGSVKPIQDAGMASEQIDPSLI